MCGASIITKNSKTAKKKNHQQQQPSIEYVRVTLFHALRVFVALSHQPMREHNHASMCVGILIILYAFIQLIRLKNLFFFFIFFLCACVLAVGFFLFRQFRFFTLLKDNNRSHAIRKREIQTENVIRDEDFFSSQNNNRASSSHRTVYLNFCSVYRAYFDYYVECCCCCFLFLLNQSTRSFTRSLSVSLLQF